jgi:ABC-type microcin C transport system duplicated ATPase subunit YejF
MSALLEVRGLTVVLPTAAGCSSAVAGTPARIRADLRFISHSLPVVAQIAARIAVMRTGQFLEVGGAEQVRHQPQHTYTRELLSAVPELLRA